MEVCDKKIFRRAVKKALKKEHQVQLTAISEHFALTGHHIKVRVNLNAIFLPLNT